MSERSKRPLMLGDFDFRSNSIGFLRLLFAAIVVWSHAYLLGGFGEDPVTRLTGGALNAGFLAVGGFFVLSGFLITRSFERVTSVERFLWHRFLRIFPAFWACLVVVAFGFAPLAFYYEHGTLAGFTSGPYSPWSYLGSNALLQMNQYNIGALPAYVPLPLIFNKSLWTLQYEFLCYLSVAALGLIGALRLKAAVAILFLFLLFVDSTVLWEHGKHVTAEAFGVIGLLVYFAAGSCAYLFRDHIPMRWWVAALCSITLAVGLPTRAYAFIVAPCVSYLTLFAAMKLPLRNFDRRMDFSYGLYIYAFPVQQMLALYGVNSIGFVPYFSCALAIALLFAAASWFTIEKPSLSLKNRTFVSGRYSSRV
jgi:peptidoglycan/LPS O-acetylase OafA/YrhL